MLDLSCPRVGAPGKESGPGAQGPESLSAALIEVSGAARQAVVPDRGQQERTVYASALAAHWASVGPGYHHCGRCAGRHTNFWLG